MLTRAILLAIDEGITGLRDAYSFEPTPDFATRWLALDDDGLAKSIISNSSGFAAELMTRLFERRLLKSIYHKELEQLDALLSNALSRMDKNQLLAAEAGIAGLLQRSASKWGLPHIDPRLVVIGIQRIPGPTYQAPGVKIEINDIVVKKRSGKTAKAINHTNNILDFATRTLAETIDIYAPLDELAKDCREALCQTLENDIEAVLTQL